ncbi:hypothetical protein VTK56DRAFT_8187 [Thermocarpiscus australiensis]
MRRIHAEILTFALLLGIPLRPKKAGPRASEPKKALEILQSVGCPSIEIIGLAFQVVVILDAQAVGVDKEAVYVLLRAVVQPGAVVEAGEGLSNGLVETLGRRKHHVGCRGVRATGGAQGGAAAPAAYLLVGLPVGFLAVARAVGRDRALGAALQSHLGRRLMASGIALGYL